MARISHLCSLGHPLRPDRDRLAASQAFTDQTHPRHLVSQLSATILTGTSPTPATVVSAKQRPPPGRREPWIRQARRCRDLADPVRPRWSPDRRSCAPPACRRRRARLRTAARLIPTDKVPVTARAALRAAATPRSRLARVSRAAVRKAAPAGVTVTPRRPRSRSWASTASSSFLIWVLSTCWATRTRWAAAVKLFSSATATKYLRCRNSMFTLGRPTNGASRHEHWP